jgi:hypothetical protein
MAIVNAQLKTTALDILDQSTGQGVPAGKSYAITNIMVCNTDGTATASFDMHLIPSGNALANKVTRVIKGLSLPASETFTFDSERIILEEGDKLVFVAEPDIGASLTNLAATVSYLEV